MLTAALEAYLCAFHANDAVQTAGGVVEEGDADRGTGSRDPRSLRLGINMEHVRLAREDRLLTANTQIIQFVNATLNSETVWSYCY